MANEKSTEFPKSGKVRAAGPIPEDDTSAGEEGIWKTIGDFLRRTQVLIVALRGPAAIQ